MGSRREAVARGAQELRAAGIENPWFEAQVLLARTLGLDAVVVMAHGEVELSAAEAGRFNQALAQRASRKPMAYIIGVKPFMHWEFIVTEDVLIPRPETEVLVEKAVFELNRNFPDLPLRLADIGTGSGVIGLSMLALLPSARLTAVDVSPAALEVARQNAQLLGVRDRVIFSCGDLLSPLEDMEEKGFHCVTANLPYIAAGEYPGLQPEVRCHEPRGALVSGPDGLCHYRRLLREVGKFLVPGGMVFIEIGSTQGIQVRQLFVDGGFPHPQVEKDLAGHDRVVWARKE